MLGVDIGGDDLIERNIYGAALHRKVDAYKPPLPKLHGTRAMCVVQGFVESNRQIVLEDHLPRGCISLKGPKMAIAALHTSMVATRCLLGQ